MMMPQDKDQPGPRVRSIHINDLAIWLVLVIWLLKNFVTVLFAPIGQNSTIGPHLTDQNTRLLSGEHATFSSLKSKLLRTVYLVAVTVVTFGWLWLFSPIALWLIELVSGSGQQYLGSNR